MEDLEGVYAVTLWAQLFITAQLVGIAIIALVAAISMWRYVCGTTRRRRPFQCALMERQVEVEFAERRVLGTLQHSTVLSCSAFESPTTIACTRRCVNSAFRRQVVPSAH